MNTVTERDVAQLYTLPLELCPMRMYCFDSASNMLFFGHAGEFIARGWGRMQYRERGEELMDAWVRLFDEVAAGISDADELVAALTAKFEALQKGVAS